MVLIIQNERFPIFFKEKIKSCQYVQIIQHQDILLCTLQKQVHRCDTVTYINMQDHSVPIIYYAHVLWHKNHVSQMFFAELTMKSSDFNPNKFIFPG